MDLSHSGTVPLVWMEKSLICRQLPGDAPEVLDYLFLTEVALTDHRSAYDVEIRLGDHLVARLHNGVPLAYVNDWLLHRQGHSYSSLAELDAAIPNSVYECSVRTAAGKDSVALNFVGPTRLPIPPAVTLRQNDQPTLIPDTSIDIEVSWPRFEPTVTGFTGSEIFPYSTIFFLVDNCRGETVFSSGSGMRRPSLHADIESIVIPAGTFEPGLNYTIFLSFIDYRFTGASASGKVASAGVNSLMLEMTFAVQGEPADGRSCPPIPLKACYRWPGKLLSDIRPIDWPVAAGGLTLHPTDELRFS